MYQISLDSYEQNEIQKKLFSCAHQTTNFITIYSELSEMKHDWKNGNDHSISKPFQTLHEQNT